MAGAAAVLREGGDEARERVAPDLLLAAVVEHAHGRAPHFEVGEAFTHRLVLDDGLSERLALKKANVLEPLQFGGEAAPALVPGSQELRTGLEAGHGPLEGDAEERRVVEDEAAKD